MSSKTTSATIAVILSLSLSMPALAACDLTRMKMQRVVNGKSVDVSGSGKRVTVHWIENDDPAEEFSTIDKTTGNECRFTGGFFDSQFVYLSKDEKSVVMVESNASYIGVHFYDTQQCRMKTRFESGVNLSVTANGAHHNGVCGDGICEGAKCECWPAEVYRFSDSCEPILDKDASLRLTENVFGVAFDRKSFVAYPKTKRARLIGPAN